MKKNPPGVSQRVESLYTGEGIFNSELSKRHSFLTPLGDFYNLFL